MYSKLTHVEEQITPIFSSSSKLPIGTTFVRFQLGFSSSPSSSYSLELLKENPTGQISVQQRPLGKLYTTAQPAGLGSGPDIL
ncbi:hypothetical protein CKAN_02125400 [Cinnamomum micranthum f. kanehirae]|uniref:Uncharacterized protein n=1 Tax=Cinnamomum micranthum f. kanehirae TaxID=337451 RepID=A0A3S3P2X7_9MAGN|nr:hypothetical protein CKAN_02125400 [Cinnamomum micranthum f. kanehirae]